MFQNETKCVNIATTKLEKILIMSTNMAKILPKVSKLTINEWLENLPSKERTRKIYELKQKCDVALSTIYNWMAGKTPRRRFWKTIQEVVGKEHLIKFN